MFLPPFFKYVVFQVQSEGYIGEDKIIDMIKVIVLKFMSLQYVLLCSKNFIIEKLCHYFPPFLKNQKEFYKNYLRFKTWYLLNWAMS